MRYLLFPLLIFVVSFIILRTSNMWSTTDNWKRIGIEVGVSVGACVLASIIIGAIVILF